MIDVESNKKTASLAIADSLHEAKNAHMHLSSDPFRVAQTLDLSKYFHSNIWKIPRSRPHLTMRRTPALMSNDIKPDIVLTLNEDDISFN